MNNIQRLSPGENQGYVDRRMKKEGSVESYFGLLDVASLFLRQFYEIDGTVVSDHCKPIIFEVESNSLAFLIHFDLGETQITLPIFVKDFHELKTENK